MESDILYQLLVRDIRSELESSHSWKSRSVQDKSWSAFSFNRLSLQSQSQTETITQPVKPLEKFTSRVRFQRSRETRAFALSIKAYKQRNVLSVSCLWAENDTRTKTWPSFDITWSHIPPQESRQPQGIQMKLWTGIFLLLVIQGPIALQSQHAGR